MVQVPKPLAPILIRAWAGGLWTIWETKLGGHTKPLPFPPPLHLPSLLLFAFHLLLFPLPNKWSDMCHYLEIFMFYTLDDDSCLDLGWRFPMHTLWHNIHPILMYPCYPIVGFIWLMSPLGFNELNILAHSTCNRCNPLY